MARNFRTIYEFKKSAFKVVYQCDALKLTLDQ